MNSSFFKYSIIILASFLSSSTCAPEKKYRRISMDESMKISSMDEEQSAFFASSGRDITMNRQNNRLSGGDTSGHGRRHGSMLGTSMSQGRGMTYGENSGRGRHLHGSSGTGTGRMTSGNSNSMGSNINADNGMGIPMGTSTGLSHQTATSMSSGTNLDSGTRTSLGNRNGFKNSIGMHVGSSNTYQTGMGMTDPNAGTFAETHFWNAELGKFVPINTAQNSETETGGRSSISTQRGTGINRKLELSQTVSSGSHGT